MPFLRTPCIMHHMPFGRFVDPSTIRLQPPAFIQHLRVSVRVRLTKLCSQTSERLSANRSATAYKYETLSATLPKYQNVTGIMFSQHANTVACSSCLFGYRTPFIVVGNARVVFSQFWICHFRSHLWNQCGMSPQI